MLALLRKKRPKPIVVVKAPANVATYTSEFGRIVQHTLEDPCRETGGQLFGWFMRDGSPRVMLATGPGPRAVRTRVRYEHDADFARANFLRAMDDHGLHYVGDWHSHHEMELWRPSGDDCGTAAQVIRASGVRMFVMLIACIRPGTRRVHLFAYLFDAAKPATPRPVEILIAPYPSPVRVVDPCFGTPIKETGHGPASRPA